MMKRALVWVSPFVLGLGIAFVGAQLLSGGEAAVHAQVPTPTSAPTTVAPSAELDDEVSPPPPSSALPAESDPGLSPLASRVRPLGSAFPAEVFPGLGDPIGVAPTAISIASLDVSVAPIEPVGIEDNGELEVPGAEAVGWYRFGAGVDGGQGSVVLAAHIAYNGVDGVFRNLVDTELGATITVADESGRTIDYRVTEVVQYAKEALPIDDLFREDGGERLVLITCGGDFNPSLLSYDDNVVVIAVPA